MTSGSGLDDDAQIEEPQEAAVRCGSPARIRGAVTYGDSAAIKKWPASELPAEDYVLRVGGGVQHAS